MKKIMTAALAALLVSTSAGAYSGVSDWAKAEIEKAEAYSLIPESLVESKLSDPITRSEFACLSVKLYEALSKKSIEIPKDNPFSDTDDGEVLKAYAAGITTGTSSTTFDPDALLSREQAATMLARAYSKSMNAEINPSGNAEIFSDDAEISDWAKESVYFMAENGIINGVGNNCFAPKNTTVEQEASRYANSTREQSIAVSVRMYEKFKPETKAEKADLLKLIPAYNFGTVVNTVSNEHGAAVTLENVTAENYSAYIKDAVRFFPEITYELPLAGTSGGFSCTDGAYKLIITYNGTQLLISVAEDTGV